MILPLLLLLLLSLMSVMDSLLDLHSNDTSCLRRGAGSRKFRSTVCSAMSVAGFHPTLQRTQRKNKTPLQSVVALWPPRRLRQPCPLRLLRVRMGIALRALRWMSTALQWSHQRSCSTPSPVSTWMGDRPPADW